MKIVIFGLAREGRSSYRFLREQFPKATIVLVDDQPLEKLAPEWRTFLAQDELAAFALSSEYQKVKSEDSVWIISPGIAPSHRLLTQLSPATPITTNLQLFLEVCLPDRARHSIFGGRLPRVRKQPLIIGVTGTKGKSTTAAAIHHTLETAKLPTLLGGNIGKPPLDLLAQIDKFSSPNQVTIVLELSSHQLNRINISPQIAVIQAITPEHLDYYPNFESYIAAKTQLVTWQKKGDLVVANHDNQYSRQLAYASAGQAHWFSALGSNNEQVEAQLIKNQLVLKDEPIVSLDELKVKGKHTAANLLPALLIGRIFKLSKEVLRLALTSFAPLPHRLQLITSKNQIEYYNDSLSTTPEAAVAAINSFPNQPIILIAGGYDRGLNYQPLAHAIAHSQVKAALLLPTTGQRIAEALQSEKSTHQVKTQLVPDLKTAVKKAQQLVKPGDVVLMSPGSASFNQFKDYQERGEKFSQYVQD